MRYFAKPNTWFDAHTEAKLTTDVWEAITDDDGSGIGAYAVFEGIRHGHPHREVCSLDEFYTKE